MAGLTISQLTDGTTANLTDLVPVTQGSSGPGTGTTVTVTAQEIINLDSLTYRTFTQPGTGAAARTLQLLFQDHVCVKDFGAKGDGVTDDTAAIQACLLACQNRGIFLPAGTYVISGTLTLGGAHILFGEGPFNTTLLCGDAFDAVVINSNGADVRDIAFTSAAARTSGSYITVNNGARFNRIKNVTMTNAFKGIYVVNGVELFIDTIDIRNTTPTSGMGVHIAGGNDTYITHLVMDTTGTQPAYGVFIQSTGAVWMTDCDLIHAGTCLLLAPQSGTDQIDWCFFENVACDTSNYGIVIEPASGLVVKGCNWVNCWTATMSGSGVFIQGPGTVDGMSFVSHRSVNNGQDGFVIAPGTTVLTTSFRGCTAAGNSQSAVNTYSGFNIGAGVSGFMITDCVSGQVLQFGATQLRGILINAGAGADFIVTNNYLVGNTVPLLNDATGYGVVSGNFGTQYSATIAVGASPFTYTANQRGQVLIGGGTISGISFQRVGQTAVAMNSSTSNVTLNASDQITVTYSVAPIMTFIGD